MNTKAELGYEELRRRLAGEAKHIESLESLLVEAIRERDEVTAQRDNLLDASTEGAWIARALDAERERDEARSALAACAAAVGGALDCDYLVEEILLLRERDEARQNERERCARICDLEFVANWHASAMAAANAVKRCAKLIRDQEKP